ncbi:MAG TPA: hypothetical protein VMW29_03525 [Candidatus Bathyarchaeia archaeon]|nr:hypothetical protein [Candidatus Bathyarchaeia archaeon]
METTDSLTAFFYNIVPGVLFIILFDYFLGFELYPFLLNTFGNIQKDRGIILTFYFLVFGLFCGFIFQGFTKKFRNWFLNEKTFKKVIEEDILSYKRAIKILQSKKLLDSDETELTVKCDKKKLGRFFYLMHDCLLGTRVGEFPIFFTTRLAFWSNIFFGILTIVIYFLLILIVHCFSRIRLPSYLLLYSFKKREEPWLALIKFVLLMVLLRYSWWLFCEYLRILYDVVLKTFVSVVKIDKEEQDTKRGKK